MRLSLFLIPILAGNIMSVSAQETDVPKTEQLKESVRTWIELMREIQKEEDSWERDRILLEDQKAALDSEIADLTERVAAAKEAKEGADKEAKEDEQTRDAYLKAKDVLIDQLAGLEKQMVDNLSVFPPPLTEDPRVNELMNQVRSDADRKDDAIKEKLTSRLNNILNLLAEAEKWQQTIHLRKEMHTNEDGREYNMQVIYIGLASAYAVNESGDFALVGYPKEDGWNFEARNDLAPDILKMLNVLNGDADAQFIQLPVELK